MKNKWDFEEVEIKVLPGKKPWRLVEIAQESAPAGWKMIRKPHVAFFDLYFDTPNLLLASKGVHLRVRFGKSSFRKKGKYKLFFKGACSLSNGRKYVSRREVRTDLSRRELLDYRDGMLPGKAAMLAYDILEESGAPFHLEPILVISTFRRYFTMRGPDSSFTDMLNLCLEQSTAIGAKEFDVVELIENGMINSLLDSRTYDFELSEAELTSETPEAKAMFQRVVANLSKEFKVVTSTKYSECLRHLDLHVQDAGMAILGRR